MKRDIRVWRQGRGIAIEGRFAWNARSVNWLRIYTYEKRPTYVKRDLHISKQGRGVAIEGRFAWNARSVSSYQPIQRAYLQVGGHFLIYVGLFSYMYVSFHIFRFLSYMWCELLPANTARISAGRGSLFIHVGLFSYMYVSFHIFMFLFIYVVWAPISQYSASLAGSSTATCCNTLQHTAEHCNTL